MGSPLGIVLILFDVCDFVVFETNVGINLMTKVATTDLIYHPISELKGMRYQLAFLEGLLMGVLLFILTIVTAAWLDLIVELESGFRLTLVIASVLAAITSLVVFMIRCSKKSDIH